MPQLPQPRRRRRPAWSRPRRRRHPPDAGPADPSSPPGKREHAGLRQEPDPGRGDRPGGVHADPSSREPAPSPNFHRAGHAGALRATAVHEGAGGAAASDQGPIAGRRRDWWSGGRGRAIMSVSRKVLVWLLLGIVFLPLPALSQDAPEAFKPEELDQLVAPIALHPDALVAQILMASTYPLEIVQAARFVKDNPKLKDDQLNEALKQHTWDDSVKSLVFFPQVLTMMNDKIDWLQKLGDAFLGQQQDLMASVQRLRARAQAAGQLKSTKEQKVIVEPAASVSTAPPPPPAGAAPAAPAPTSVQVVQPAS